MENKKRIIALIIISAVLVLAVGMAITETADLHPQNTKNNINNAQPDNKQDGNILRENTADFDIFLKTLVSLINLGLTIPLFVIYAGIYRKIRSSFTFGLLAVILALGIYAATSNPMIITLAGGIPGYIGIFQIIPDICATAALIILTGISLE